MRRAIPNETGTNQGPDEAEGRAVRVRVLTGGGLAALVLGLVALITTVFRSGGETTEPIPGRFFRQPFQVSAVAIAPDGQSLAVGRADGFVDVEDSSRGYNRRFPVNPGSPIRSLAFSPDSRTLASAGPGPEVNLWDPATGETLATITDHPDPALSVAFSPDGKTLAWGSARGRVRLWDLSRGQPLVSMAGHDDEVRGLAYAPDGKTLASGSFDGTIKLWDVPEGRERLIFRGDGKRRRVYGVAISPDGRTLAFGLGATISGERGLVGLWDLANPGRAIRTLGEYSFSTVAFAPDGKTLATAGGDRLVKLWDVETGRDRATLTGHEGYIGSLAFSPDGRTLVTGGQDALVGKFNLAPDAKSIHCL